MVEIALNLHKRDNYAFFDPESRLHLTYSNVRGVVSHITKRIEHGIKTGVIIVVNKDNKPVEKPQETKIEPATEEPVESVEPVPVEPVEVKQEATDSQVDSSLFEEPITEEPVDDSKKSKRGRKS